MKNSSLKQLVAVAMGLALSSLAVQAAPVNGEITFDGIATLNGALDSASSYVTIMSPGGPGMGPIVTGAIGDYAGTLDQHANFTSFTFSPAPLSPFELWNFTYNSTVYRFEATSVSSSFGLGSLHVYGNGLAYVGNSDPTPATWSFTDTGVAPYFTFGAACSAVPEPTSIALGMIGLAALALRRIRSHA